MKTSEWQTIDQALVSIAKRRASLDAEELRWLREAVREEIWHELGMVSLQEYLEARLGYTPRVASDRVRVALALEHLPALTGALEAGELPFTAVRELARVATQKTDAAWTAAGQDKNVRQIEELVANHQRGDWPDSPENPALRLQTIRLDVRPETLAKFREIVRRLESESGLHLDDDQILSALCDERQGPEDRAKHQILVTRCDRCERADSHGAGRRFAIGRAALELTECDAQYIDPITHRTTQDIPPRTRRFVTQRDGGRCCVPGCRASRYLHLHHIVPRSQGGSHDPDNLTLLCSGHHRAHHDGQLTITGRAPHLSFSTHVGCTIPSTTPASDRAYA